MSPHGLRCLKEVCRGHRENFRRRVLALVGDAGTELVPTSFAKTLGVEAVERLTALGECTGLGTAEMARNAPARGVVAVFQSLVRPAGI